MPEIFPTAGDVTRSHQGVLLFIQTDIAFVIFIFENGKIGWNYGSCISSDYSFAYYINVQLLKTI